MRINDGLWLLNNPIAHRGLWGGNIPENSLPAYQNAVDNGYPIEIDVYITKDEKLVCFHDQTLDRMTGANGHIYDKTLAELKELRLNGTEHKIVSFDEVLSICRKKTPLLIEIKDQPNKKVVDLTVARLKDYDGEFAVQSFNPLYLKRVKKLAPEFLRGILATGHAPEKNFFVRYLLKNMSLNFLSKPDFISYRYNDLPLPKRKVKNLPVICWTVTTQETFDKVKLYAKNIIFENFIPKK